MIGLLYRGKTMTICSAVLIQYQRVTDRRTDRIAISISRVSLLERDKNSAQRTVPGFCVKLSDIRKWHFYCKQVSCQLQIIGSSKDNLLTQLNLEMATKTVVCVCKNRTKHSSTWNTNGNISSQEHHYSLTPTTVARVKLSSASACLSVRTIEPKRLNYNHQACHRDSPSRVLSIHLILGQGHRAKKYKKYFRRSSGQREFTLHRVIVVSFIWYFYDLDEKHLQLALIIFCFVIYS